MLTGSWYGGGFIGAMMGMLIITGLNSAQANHESPSAREVEQDSEDNSEK